MPATELASWKPTCGQWWSSHPPGIVVFPSNPATLAWAKIPVNMLPTSPPMAWEANIWIQIINMDSTRISNKLELGPTSSASSQLNIYLIWVAKLQNVPAATPNRTAAASDLGFSYMSQRVSSSHSRAPTKPDPGVIATRPEIAPEQ